MAHYLVFLFMAPQVSINHNTSWHHFCGSIIIPHGTTNVDPSYHLMAPHMWIDHTTSWHHFCGSIIIPNGTTSVDQSYRHMAPQVLMDFITEPHNLPHVAQRLWLHFILLLQYLHGTKSANIFHSFY